MRFIPLLLLIACCLPSGCAEAEQIEAWRARLTSQLQELSQGEASLAAHCAAASVTVPDGVAVEFARQRKDGEAWLEKLKAAGVDDSGLEDYLNRLGQVTGEMAQLGNMAQELTSRPQQFPHALDSAEAKALHDLALQRIGTGLGALAAGRNMWDEAFRAGQGREQRLQALLSVIEAERAVGDSFPKLATGQPPLSEFLESCRRLHERLAKLEDAPVRPKQQMNALGYAAIAMQALQYWRELLQCEVERRGFAEGDAQDASRLAALGAAGALQAGLRQGIDNLLADTQDPGRATEAREEAEGRLQALRDAWQASSELMGARREGDEQRKRIVEQLAKLGEAARKPLQARLDQHLAEVSTVAAAALKAQADGDRLAALEAKGAMAVANARIGQLADEAEQEAELAELEQRWKGHEQDAFLAEALKRYRTGREALAKARARSLQSAVAQQQVRNRIEQLEFKERAVQARASEADQALNRAQEEVRRLGEQIGETLQGGDPKQRERDAKEAERIPLVAPGDNNF
jgi:hypothetical protein